MKGLIPIIIATVLVLSIVLSSLYFITTMNIRSSVTNVSYSTVYWLKMENELDNLAYIALKYGSEAADAEFENEYNNLIQSATDLDDLKYAIGIAAQKANQTMYDKVKSIVDNWIELKKNEGIIIRVKNLSSAYVVDFGLGYSNVYFDFVIITPTGESREFSRNYTVYYSIKLEKTSIDSITNNLIVVVKSLLDILGLKDLIPDINFTLVFDTKAYLELDNKRYYYVISDKDASALIKSFVGASLLFNPSLISANYSLIGTYYYGNGNTKIAYKVNYDNLSLLESLALFLSSILNEQYLGVTSSIDIDGCKARSAILITS